MADVARLREILRLGLPFTGSLVTEGSLIAAPLLVSALGTIVVAAHQVALSYSLLTYMIPAAFHSATSVRVGHMLAAADLRRRPPRGAHGHRLVRGPGTVSALVLGRCSARDFIASALVRSAIRPDN